MSPLRAGTYYWQLVGEQTATTLASGTAADQPGIADQLREAIAQMPVRELVNVRLTFRVSVL